MRLLVALAIGMAWASPGLAAIDRVTLMSMASGVLKIEVVRAEGGYSIGSGVVVAPGRVVTNCHVTRNALRISVVRGGLRWPVTAQSSDPYHDLCVLNVDAMQGKPFPLGDSTRLAIGQSVTALGYTGGGEIQSSSGEVQVLHRMDGARVIRSSNFFSSGASGGALFDDDLRLVGVLTFRLRGGAAHYYAVPIEWVVRELDAAFAQPVEPLSPGVLAFWEQPASAQPLFLQAASLERAGDWASLRPLAANWARGVTDDPEPWYLLGVAFDGQSLPNEARRALECSLAIASDFEPARRRLDSIYLGAGLTIGLDEPPTPCRL